MQQFIGDFEQYYEIADTLEKGGYTDYSRYPEVYIAVQAFRRSGHVGLLRRVLEKDPIILAKALCKIKEFPFLPYPNGEELKTIQGMIRLGYVNQNFNMAGLDPIDLTKGLFVCGEPGTGKSYFILYFLDQILSTPIEERGFNVIIVQALKRDADFMIKKYSNLRVIEWEDARLAPAQVESWDTPKKKMDRFCESFTSANWLAAYGEPLFKQAIKRAMIKNGVFEGSGCFPTYSEIKDEVDGAANDIGLSGHENKNVRDRIRFVLTPFLETGKILNRRISFTIEDFFSKEDMILTVKDEKSDYVLGTTIPNLMIDLQEYYELHPSPGLRTLIVFDECRRLFPRPEGYTAHNPDSQKERFMATRRSSGIGTIFATQEPQSTPDWVLTNSAFFMTFPIAGEAIEYLKKYQNLSDEQTDYIEKLPQTGTCIFRDRRFNRKYIMDIPGTLEVEQITRNETRDLMADYIKKAHAKIEKQETEIEKAKAKFNQTPPTDNTEEYFEKMRKDIYDHTFLCLELLQKEPFTPRNAIKKKVKGSQKAFDASIKWLIDNGFVIHKKIIASKTQPSNFYPITKKGHDLLKTPDHKRKPTPHSFQHILYCRKVAESLKGQGLKAKIEYIPTGENETLEIQGKTIKTRIDVYAFQEGKHSAYEITLSPKTAVSNLYKCAVKLNMDEVHFVCEKDKIESVKNRIESNDVWETIQERSSVKVFYRDIKEFL